MAFGPPKYMPGQIKSQSLGPVGFDETMAMLNATAPSPIQAPKDRGMFGRFMGILAGGKYGDEQMGWVERLGRGADGMNAIRDEQRMLKRAQEEEVKRREMAEQLGMYDGQAALFAMDPTLALGERRDQRNFDRSVLESDRSYGLQQDQFSLEQNKFGWQQGTDVRNFNEGVRQFGLNHGLQSYKAAQGGAGEYGLAPIYGRDAQGNRVLIQTNKAGGVRQADLPEGVTLEDDMYRAAGSALGKGQADLILQKSKKESGLEAVKSEFLNLEQTIDRAIKQTNWSNTGFIGQANFTATDLNATLKTIRANAAFTTLQEMRANSPTGGALGQVSERELDLLMAAAAALERSQNQKQLDANLAAFKEKLRGSMLRLERAFEQDYNSGLFGNMTVESARAQTFGSPGQQQGGATDPDIDSLLQKYGGP